MYNCWYRNYLFFAPFIENNWLFKLKDLNVLHLSPRNQLLHFKTFYYITIVGCVGAAVAGGVQPSFAIIFSEFLKIFSQISTQEEKQKSVNLLAGLFAVIGVISFVAYILTVCNFIYYFLISYGIFYFWINDHYVIKTKNLLKLVESLYR